MSYPTYAQYDAEQSRLERLELQSEYLLKEATERFLLDPECSDDDLDWFLEEFDSSEKWLPLIRAALWAYRSNDLPHDLEQKLETVLIDRCEELK